MMVSGGSNGEDGPKSTMNPVPFEDVWKVTEVPSFTQNRELPFGLGKARRGRGAVHAIPLDIDGA